MNGYLFEQLSTSSRIDTTPLKVTAPSSKASDTFENHLRAPDSSAPPENPSPPPPASASSASNARSSDSGSSAAASNSSTSRSRNSERKARDESPPGDQSSDSNPASTAESSAAPQEASRKPNDEGGKSPHDAASHKDSKTDDDDATKTAVVAVVVNQGQVEPAQKTAPSGKAAKVKTKSDSESDENGKGSTPEQKTKIAKASAQTEPVGSEPPADANEQNATAEAAVTTNDAKDDVKQAAFVHDGAPEAKGKEHDEQSDRRGPPAQHTKTKAGTEAVHGSRAAVTASADGLAKSGQVPPDAQAKSNAVDSQSGKGQPREGAVTHNRRKELDHGEAPSIQQNTLQTPSDNPDSANPPLTAIVDSTNSDDTNRVQTSAPDAHGDKPAAPSGPSGGEASAGNGTSGGVGRLSQHLVNRGKSAEGGPELREADHTRFLNRVARAFEAAQDRGGGEIRLRLSPPELGSLKLHVKIDGGALSAHIEADTHHARTMLIDNLPQLRERLAEQNIRVEHFDVDVPDRQSGGAPDHSHDGWREQSDAAPRLPRGGGEAQSGDEASASIGAARYQTGSSQLNVII